MTALGILLEHPVPVAVALIGAVIGAWRQWVEPITSQPTDAEIALDVARQDLRDRRIYDAIARGKGRA